MREFGIVSCVALLGSCHPRGDARVTVPSPPMSMAREVPTAGAGAPSEATTSTPPPAPLDPDTTPRPVSSGASASLPQVPALPQRRLEARAGVYTVWGASYSLRHRALSTRIRGQVIQVRGFVGATTLPEVPSCAVHPAGVADSANCRTPVPAFWLCDEADATPEDCIQVVGWASNHAQLYSAILQYASHPAAERRDDYWGITIPNPIPARGAVVTVTGRYDATFTGASSGAISDPIMGILTYRSMTYEKPPPIPARLPGMP